MKYGIMFFSSGGDERDKYRLLLDSTRFADEHGFTCVWTPERHFHAFGGLFPNPAVTGAALATITNQIQIRAGSLISPLHHNIRIAEEWSVVDNLSGGRVAIAFGSGWNTNDFIFFPENYRERQTVMHDQIEKVSALWRGESMTYPNTFGKDVTVKIHPRPIQAELPVWVTSSGNIETIRSAGSKGHNVLTHLIGQDLEQLGEKIAVYRRAREEGGHDPRAGIVSLMLHTYLGEDTEEIKKVVYHPFREYLRSAVKLELAAADGGGAISGGHKIDSQDLGGEDMETLLDLTFERYFYTGALLGTPAHCSQLIWQLREIGVDEIACLIDFLDRDIVMKGMPYLDELRQLTSAEAEANSVAEAANAFMEDFDE